MNHILILIHHRSTAYESFTTGPRYVTLSRLVPCYKRDWATLLLLLLMLLLCCCCYCCSLLLRCYLLQDPFPTLLSGKNSYSPTCNLLAPLIQQLGIVCRQQIISGTVAIIYFATDTLLADTNLSGVVESDTFSC